MNNNLSAKFFRIPGKPLALTLFAAVMLLSCGAAGRTDNPQRVPEKFEAGETVYVCGCPMMCCQSVSRIPGGRCACNFPLKAGTVSRIQDGKIFVKLSDREKSFPIPYKR